MLTYPVRSEEEELMDDLSISKDHITLVLRDIRQANHLLGGNAITIKAIKRHIQKHQPQQLTIMDVGCGDGDMLRAIARQLAQSSTTLNLIGVDINPDSIQIARELTSTDDRIRYECVDILDMNRTLATADIILCTLTLHHFSDDQLIPLVKRMTTLARRTVIINDLHRSRLAAWLFVPFSHLFMKTKIAKQDGLTSIKSGFVKSDLESYAQRLGLQQSQISWKWAFRYLWIIQTS
ncbi:MAG: methyltransferase domain-containing protein [Bacteroidota bacterium]